MTDRIEQEGRYYTKEYNPKASGFFMWFTLDDCLESYPEHDPTQEEERELKMWILLTFRRIRCPECRQDALRLLSKYPVATSSRAAAKEWLTFIHNTVNEKLGKRVLSPQEAQKSNNLMHHVNWTNVWSDLTADKLYLPPSPWRTYAYMACIFMLLIFVAVFIVWLKDSGKRDSLLEEGAQTTDFSERNTTNKK